MIGRIIHAVYSWFCFTVLQRPHGDYFTWQFARMAIAHGALFWTALILPQFWAYHRFDPEWYISLPWLIANVWFIDHIIDHVRTHPENLPNRHDGD